MVLVLPKNAVLATLRWLSSECSLSYQPLTAPCVKPDTICF